MTSENLTPSQLAGLGAAMRGQRGHAGMPDDVTCGQVMERMREQLLVVRERGQQHWLTADDDVLWRILRDHVEGQRPEQVAFLAMLLAARQQ
jgi:hypothetical protein